MTVAHSLFCLPLIFLVRPVTSQQVPVELLNFVIGLYKVQEKYDAKDVEECGMGLIVLRLNVINKLFTSQLYQNVLYPFIISIGGTIFAGVDLKATVCRFILIPTKWSNKIKIKIFFSS